MGADKDFCFRVKAEVSANDQLDPHLCHFGRVLPTRAISSWTVPTKRGPHIVGPAQEL
jgi:hypothetical protein